MKLQNMTFRELPNESYYWRSGYPEVWMKLGDNDTYNLGDPFPEVVVDFLDEIVLYYPFDIILDEEIRQQIIQWTGNPKAHIFPP
jgi:hypothetical protein